MAAAAAAAAGNNNQPIFIRYFLQFPPVTRTLLLLIFLISVSLYLNILNRYLLYTTLWGRFLRFFDAGWGLYFLLTLVMSILALPMILLIESISAEFSG